MPRKLHVAEDGVERIEGTSCHFPMAIISPIGDYQKPANTGVCPNYIRQALEFPKWNLI